MANDITLKDEQCKQLCDKTPKCDSITMDNDNNYYRRKLINIEKCDTNTQYTTYVRPYPYKHKK